MEEAVQRFRDENNTDYQSVGVEVMRHVAEQNICFGEEIDFLTADVYLPYTYLEIDTIIHSPLAKVDPDLTHGIHLFYGHPRISEAIHDPTTPIHKLLFYRDPRSEDGGGDLPGDRHPPPGQSGLRRHDGVE
jgi:hypothetical protein